MIDLQLLRNPEFVEQLQNAAEAKRMKYDAYLLAATFDERRQVAGQLDRTRARQKTLSASFRDADAATRAASTASELASSASCSAADSSSSASMIETCSTFSNWCTRYRPCVSRP